MTKFVVSRPRERPGVIAVSPDTITGMGFAFITGVFCLVAAVVLLSGCQQPSTSAANGSSAYQQMGDDMPAKRRCCHRAGRGNGN